MQETYGTYETIDGAPAIRFERRLGHPIERVWRAVTEPAELAHWFPQVVEIEELRPGAPLRFASADGATAPMDGRIAEVDPPRLLVFFWGDERLRFELEPAAGGEACILRFTQMLSASDAAARNAAGWHVCLDRLELHLAGAAATAPGSEPTDEWRGHYEEYQRRGVPAGAPVPGD